MRFADGRVSAKRCLHSPWHLLWLLWPLSLLGKWALPAAASLWELLVIDILPWLQMPQMAIAVLCIVLGLVLIFRPVHSDQHPYDQ